MSFVLDILPRVLEYFILCYAMVQILTPRLKKSITVIIFVIITSSAQALASPLRERTSFVILIMFSTALIQFAFLFKDKYRKVLLVWISLYAFLLAFDVVVSISLYGSQVFVSGSIEQYESVSRRLATILLTVLFSAVSTIVVALYKRIPKSEFRLTAGVQLLLVFSQCLLIISAFTTGGSEFTDTKNAIFMFSIIPAVLVNILSSSVITRSAQLVEEKKAVEFEKLANDKKYDYYMLALEKENAVSIIRHDVANSLQTAYILFENDEKQKGLELVNEITAVQNAVKPIKYCENSIINIILATKIKESEKQAIKTEISVTDSFSDIPLSDREIVSLLANLIDNAIEGAKTAKDTKVIHISLGKKGGFFVFSVSNSASPEIVELSKSTDFSSTKRDKKAHGYGMKILKTTAESYGGTFEVKAEDNAFKATVTISEKIAE